MKLEPTKCEYLRPEWEYLGHLITKDGANPNPTKQCKKPTSVKQIKSFLGLVGYCRNCIKNFNKLKNLICGAPVLRFYYFTKELTLTIDASNVGLGAVRSQDGHRWCFASRTLNLAEQNCRPSEKELLAIICAIKRLGQYLLGKKFRIQTDHEALLWLHKVKDQLGRRKYNLVRWTTRSWNNEHMEQRYKL